MESHLKEKGVTERHNQTSMDMIRSMMNNSLPISLWVYALKIAIETPVCLGLSSERKSI